MMEFSMRPIGIIHSQFTDKRSTPIQPTRSSAMGTVEVYTEFAEGLRDIEGVDVLDGTPLLDIRPYVPDFDLRTGVRTGWLEDRS